MRDFFDSTLEGFVCRFAFLNDNCKDFFLDLNEERNPCGNKKKSGGQENG